MHQRRGHHQELSSDVKTKGFHQLQGGQVLLGDRRDGNVSDTHFIPLDQMEQEIERPLKNLELYVCAHSPNVSRTSIMVSVALR